MNQVEPFLRYRSAVWQRRRVGREPSAIDAGREGDLAEMACCRPAVGVDIEVAHDKLGGDGA
jgi:hypothetical protein